MLKPDTYFKNPEFLERVKTLEPRIQQAICEIMCGSIIKHSFYVSKKKNTVAKYTNMDNVPFIYTIKNLPAQIADYIAANPNLIGTRISFSWKSDFLGDVSINISVSNYTEYLFRNMIDETKSLSEIHKAMEKDIGKKISDTEFLGELKRIFPVLEEVGALILRHKTVKINPLF